MTRDRDLVRRGDAIKAVTDADRDCRGAHGARENIAALPAHPVQEPPSPGVTAGAHEFYLGNVDARVAEMTDVDVWQLCLDGDEFERRGKIGDCLLRREAETWMDRLGLAHDHVAIRMTDFVHAAHKRRSIQSDTPAPVTDWATAGATGAVSDADFLRDAGMDGAKWAAGFKAIAERLGHHGMDEGWLIGWFCNAIMAGYDEAERRYRNPTPAPVVPAEGLADYDAGLLNDFGGGNVEWWQDYLRAEIGRANDFWRDQVSALRSAPPVGARVTVQEAARVLLDAIGDYDRNRGHSDYDPSLPVGDALLSALAALLPAGEGK